MDNHSEAEHQYNGIDIKFDRPGQVQYIKYTVIAKIDYERIDCIIDRFSKPDKNIIDNGTAYIGNIERCKLESNYKYLICIG